jgi:hypothetical protein
MKMRKWGFGGPRYSVSIWHPKYKSPVHVIMETKSELKLLLLGSTTTYLRQPRYLVSDGDGVPPDSWLGKSEAFPKPTGSKIERAKVARMQDLVEEMMRDPIEYMKRYKKTRLKRFPRIKLDL